MRHVSRSSRLSEARRADGSTFVATGARRRAEPIEALNVGELLFVGALLLAAIVAAAGAWVVGGPRRAAFLREVSVVVAAYFL